MTERNLFRLWFGCMAMLSLVVLALMFDIDRHRIVPAEPAVIVVEPSTTTSTIPASTTTSTPPTTVNATILPNVEQFFACVRWRESRNDYTVVDATGTFMGAYQFYQGGWDTFAAKINRHDLVGVPPNMAAPADQDAVALAAYKELGSQPWGGHCG